MRKAKLVLLILLMVELQLNAQIFRSNQLGQLLSETDSVSDSGYCIVVEGDSRQLYLDGKLVSERSISTVNGSTYIIEKAIGHTITLQYADGLLIREMTESSLGKTSIIYSYMEGRLAFCSIFENGKNDPDEVIFFLRSSDGKDPVAINHNGTLTLITDRYLYQDGHPFEILSQDTVIEGDYVITETGDIVIMEGDTQHTYSSEGLLLSSESPRSRVEYSYEDYVILEKTTYLGDSYTIESYENGKAYQLKAFEDGKLESVTVYQDSGNVQTLYSNGSVIATVYYKPDNRTVDRIVYN